MKAWIKWSVCFGMFLQAAVGGIVIAWWFFPQASIFQNIFAYLLTDFGQKVILGLGIYLVVLAVLWLSWTISRPTTQGSMTIHRDHASKVQIDQKAVENNVRLTLGKYDLFNIEVKVKLLSNRKQADVVVVATLSQTTDPTVLESQITQTVRRDLKEMLNIELRRLNLKLKPYHYDQKVTIV